MFNSLKVYRKSFENLPVVSRDEVLFFNLWASLAPRQFAAQDFHQKAVSVLEPYLHAPIYCEKSSGSRFLFRGDLSKVCIPPTLILQIAVLPLDKRVLVEFSPNLAKIILDRSLGGTGESVEEGLPLSSIERGIFSFLFLNR